MEKRDMKLYDGKRPRSLCLLMLTLLCVSLPEGQADVIHNAFNASW